MEEIIIIDDNEINNFNKEKMIKSVSSDLNVKCYTDSVLALREISTKNLQDNTTILLDLDIPDMNGWEFLKLFETNKANTKCNIYILSSSQNPNDEEAARKNSSINGYLSKPLTIEKINQLIRTGLN